MGNVQAYHPLLVLVFQVTAPCVAAATAIIAVLIARSGSKERALDRRRAAMARATMVVVSTEYGSEIRDGRYLTDPAVKISNTSRDTIVDLLFYVEFDNLEIDWEWAISRAPRFLAPGATVTLKGGADVQEDFRGNRYAVVPAGDWRNGVTITVTWHDVDGNRWSRDAKFGDRPVPLWTRDGTDRHRLRKPR